MGDGVSFSLKPTTIGKALDGRCEVVVAGITPVARFWTVTLYNADGGLVANSINRYGFTSQEIVRRSDGSFEIVVARAPIPATGCRPAASIVTSWCCGSTTRRGRFDQGRPRSPDADVTTRSCP